MSFVVKKVIVRKDGTRSREYDEISICSPISVNHFYIVEANGKYGMVDEDGYELCEPQFDKLEKPQLGEEYLRFEINGQEGILNRKGNRVT